MAPIHCQKIQQKDSIFDNELESEFDGELESEPEGNWKVAFCNLLACARAEIFQVEMMKLL